MQKAVTVSVELELARQALELAERYDLAPVPRTFEILYAHVSGAHPDMSARIDELVEQSGTLGQAAIDQIYTDFIDARAIQSTLETIGVTLGRELTELFSRISTGLEGNSRYANLLRDGMRDLSATHSKDEIREIARQMVRSNQSALSMNTELSQQLEISRLQLDEMRRELDVMRENAFTDHLTQLPNRRFLDETLLSAMAEAAETGQPLSYATIDLDHFKQVNDKWGHAVGDSVLVRLSRTLRKKTKGQDTAARLGGEEFALLMPNTNLAGATAACEAVRAGFEELAWVRQVSNAEIGTITLSAGVTEVRDDDTPHSIMERADQLLYQAKSAGRNRVVAGG